MFTALGYFEDIEEDKRAARNAWRLLVPGGAPYDQTARRLVVVGLRQPYSTIWKTLEKRAPGHLWPRFPADPGRTAHDPDAWL